jgi:translocator protein
MNDAIATRHSIPPAAALLISVGICFAIGFTTGYFFRPGEWYAALDKPPFNPPSWLFAPVWTVLYVMMGVAAWRIWKTAASAERTTALRSFAVQLVLNAAWSPTVFGMHSLGGGVAVIVAMAFAIIVTIQRFHPIDKIAARLLYPYLGWVAFATALNVSLWALNSF